MRAPPSARALFACGEPSPHAVSAHAGDDRWRLARSACPCPTEIATPNRPDAPSGLRRTAPPASTRAAGMRPGSSNAAPWMTMWQWCRMRSIRVAAMTSPPSTLPDSSKPFPRQHTQATAHVVGRLRLANRSFAPANVPKWTRRPCSRAMIATLKPDGRRPPTSNRERNHRRRSLPAIRHRFPCHSGSDSSFRRTTSDHASPLGLGWLGT